jgi:hypothetical protein
MPQEATAACLAGTTKHGQDPKWHTDSASQRARAPLAPVIQAHTVPMLYPRTASRTPIGARAWLNAAAMMGAEAAPPMLACEPTCMHIRLTDWPPTCIYF